MLHKMEALADPSRSGSRVSERLNIPQNHHAGEKMGKRKVLSEANLSEMLTPGPGQMYGTVKNLLGYDRVLVECADGVTRVCRIRGKMKRRVWIKMGDTVLVAPWDFQQERGDIMFRYTQGQVESLRRSGQLKM